MCGIVGYVGVSGSLDYLLHGLKSLEYRGYDSAGVATVKNDRLNIVHAVGKVKILEERLVGKDISSNIGIAHTRWATHGRPTDENSHPHTDCKKEIAVVHNGIIENYLKYKDELVKLGHNFSSETDTEVVAHLLEEELKNVKTDYEINLIKAVSAVKNKLDGSYALNILWKHSPDMIVGTRIKAPLVIGVSDTANYFASDVSAFTKYTDRVIYLDDGDIAAIRKDKVTIYDSELKEKKFTVVTLDKTTSDATKNGLEHFMLKEIREQPNTIKSTLEAVMVDINKAFGIEPKDLKDVRNILMIGCGTAYHATMVAKYWMEEFTSIPTQSELASEYKYRKVAMPDETLAIFVSQSGETADTVAALEKAKSSGFKTVSICNVYGSTLSRLSDHTFFTKCGPEISVASTKAFTSQLTALFALAVLIGLSVENIGKAKADELLKELDSVPAAINNLLKNEHQIEELAGRYFHEKSFIFLGRNVNYPIALEGALKLKEISYLQAEGFAAGEIKHGPIAIIEDGMPVLSLMGYDAIFEKMVNAAQEVIARGANLIAITDKKGEQKLLKQIKDKIVLEDLPSYLFPIVNVVSLQLFAYYIAKLNGRDIDQPRNLAKSVTVE